MTAISGSHAAIVRQLNRLVVKQVGEGYMVDVQNPIRLNDDSEPPPYSRSRMIASMAASYRPQPMCSS